MRNRELLPPLIVAVGLILAAAVFGIFFKSARGAEHTLRVTGSASKGFVADIAKWRLTLSRQVSDGGQSDGYAALRDEAARLRATLSTAGLPDSAFTVLPPSAQPMWANGERSGYQLQQPIYVISDRPEILERLATDPAAFASGGTAVDNSQIEYFYSGLAELKHSLLADATRDARRRAEEIASATDAAIGGIASARSGVFQITEPYSTEVSGMGMYSTSTRRKEIAVTVHADFQLE